MFSARRPRRVVRGLGHAFLYLGIISLSFPPLPPTKLGRLRACRGRTCAAKSTPTDPDPRRLFRSLPFAHLSPCEPLDTPISRQASTCLVVQTVPCHATQFRMNEQDVAEMRALLDAAGVRRCAGAGALPQTQCGQGKADCGCGTDRPCCFTLAELEKKVRALPRPHSPLQLRFSVCSCARRRGKSLESSLEKTVRSRQRFLSQRSGWMESCCAVRALWGRGARGTGPWSASH